MGILSDCILISTIHFICARVDLATYITLLSLSGQGYGQVSVHGQGRHPDECHEHIDKGNFDDIIPVIPNERYCYDGLSARLQEGGGEVSARVQRFRTNGS